jgi:hypothetical protein
MGRAYSVHGENEECLKNSGLKRDWKKPLGRPRLKWEYNIKIDFREIGLESVDWIHLAHDRDQ